MTSGGKMFHLVGGYTQGGCFIVSEGANKNEFKIQIKIFKIECQ